jgi:hypothetical protein
MRGFDKHFQRPLSCGRGLWVRSGLAMRDGLEVVRTSWTDTLRAYRPNLERKVCAPFAVGVSQPRPQA